MPDVSYLRQALSAITIAALSGCAQYGPPPYVDPAFAAYDPNYQSYEAGSAATDAVVAFPNPISIGLANQDYVWDQIVDAVDDRYKIDREDRVRRLGEVLTEGRLDSDWVVSATLLEPQLTDTVGFYNRLESTLQTMRRKAIVRVVPNEQGYLVYVEVLKELENLSKPEHTSAGAATFRENNSVNDPIDLSDSVKPLGTWIPKGRDVEAEQAILADIYDRLAR